jgi:hypothetical protein
VHRYNLDISSCDASHGPALFDAFIGLGSGEARADLAKLVEQCSQPLRVYDLRDRKRYVQLKPLTPKLYSGSTITTALNNLANVLIAISIAEAGATTGPEIMNAARDVGYILTVEVCELFEDLQFLKHSPVLDTQGQWRPVLNIGVLLRLSGVCKFDLPGSGPLEARGRAFQRCLLQGAYPTSHFPLIDNMKRVVEGHDVKLDAAVAKKVAETLAYRVDFSTEDEERHYHSADLYRRYRLTNAEQYTIDQVFGNAGYGQSFTSSGASLILDKDYNLSCRST